MPDKWVTFAEAAAALKVHPRTIERQMKSGKLQSRRTDAGQLEVLIDIPETMGTSADALSVVAGQAENQVQFALGATSAIVKTAQEDARLARLDSERAWEETRVARRGSLIAWSTVGVMVVALLVAVGWTASAMTRSQVELRHAAEQVKVVSDTAGQVTAERDNLRQQLADANEKRMRAEGELSGRVSADHDTMALALRKEEQPTTRPSLLESRLANILSGTALDTPGGE
jgi:hypothetical protein